jgi:aspartate racemase
MKTVGLIGGMSWESTKHYYQLMNQQVHAKLGGHHSIEAIIYSVNFERILKLVHQNEWEKVAEEIAKLAKKIEIAGASFLILTSNAIHKVFSQVQTAIGIPILHIADPTAEVIQKAGIQKIALLGTKVTMEESFYKDRLLKKAGIETLIPDDEDRDFIHKIIFGELTIGKIEDSSRKKILTIINKLWSRGARGIILGCTELTLLVSQKDTPVPLFDTTTLHVTAAVDLAC